MLRAALLFALLTITSAPVRAQGCPPTSYDLYEGSLVGDSSLPTGRMNARPPGIPAEDGQSMTVSWDAPGGTLSMSSIATSLNSYAIGFVESADDFELLGTATGERATVIATLDLDAASFCSGTFCVGLEGQIRDAFGHVSTAAPSPPGTMRFVLPVELVGGTPLRLHYRLRGATGPIPLGVAARLSFANVPAGRGVRSCRGFLTAVVTSGRATSWGRVKRLFR